MSSGGHDIQLHELVALRSCARGMVFRHRSKVNATLGGAYYSHHRGRGMDFDEVRLYQPGDDLRSVDWRVTARRNMPHTKVFKEERERPIYIVVDFRSSMYFGTRVAFKSVVAAKIAAIMSWAAVEAGDRVGALFITTTGSIILRPQPRQKAALMILKKMADLTQRQPEHYHSSVEVVVDSFKMLTQVIRPNGLVFLISDFQGIDAVTLSVLQTIAQKQQLVSVMVYDALEESLPHRGEYTFADQSNRLSIVTSNTLCDRYQATFLQRQTELRTWHNQHSAKWISLRTDGNIIGALRQAL